MSKPHVEKKKAVVPREKTVLLDQFNVGETFGYERSKDGSWCSGEPVCHERDEQSSFQYKMRTQYEDI